MATDHSSAAGTAASTPSSGASTTLADGIQAALHDLECDGSQSHHHADCWGEAQVIARHLRTQGPYQVEARRVGPVAAVLAERRAQVEKWGDQSRQPDSRWLAILMEEVGEAAQVMLEATATGVPGDLGKEPHLPRWADVYKADRQRLREEVTQVAAVAVAWLESLGDD